MIPNAATPSLTLCVQILVTAPFWGQSRLEIPSEIREKNVVDSGVVDLGGDRRWRLSDLEPVEPSRRLGVREHIDVAHRSSGSLGRMNLGPVVGLQAGGV
jgi:hypothetical protein